MNSREYTGAIFVPALVELGSQFVLGDAGVFLWAGRFLLA